jgi:hypothetical protein
LQNLDERINSLIEYIPYNHKCFVKHSQNKFYLPDLFVKVKKAIIDDKQIYKIELYEAFDITEQSIYHLIEKRLVEIKN